MAPVVHGLEQQYEARVDFLYLDVSDPRNKTATNRLGFTSTPHFFFLRSDGSVVESIQGVVPRDSLAEALERLVAVGSTR
jgi:thioredoxin-like negative regulator of GroEL